MHRGEQGLFESVGFKLFNLTGVEGPNTNYVQFRIIENASETGATQFDSDFQGLYLALEQPDGNMLDEHELPDGNFYKMESGTGSLNNQGPTQPTDRSDLNSFLNTYNNSTPVNSGGAIISIWTNTTVTDRSSRAFIITTSPMERTITITTILKPINGKFTLGISI